MFSNDNTIDHNRLCTLLSYYPDSGDFVWNIAHKGGKAQPGTIAGALTLRGYIAVKVDKVRYCAHRLAWFYTHGEWPPHEIDHINGIRNDNRIVNLRLATRAQNRSNGKRYNTNKSGFKGVTSDKRKWGARIHQGGKSFYLGSFKSREEAHRAYCAAAQKLFGEFWRAA